jgi:hypothetical protein
VVSNPNLRASIQRCPPSKWGEPARSGPDEVDVAQGAGEIIGEVPSDFFLRL